MAQHTSVVLSACALELWKFGGWYLILLGIRWPCYMIAQRWTVSTLYQAAHLLSLHCRKWHAKTLNGNIVHLIIGHETTLNCAQIFSWMIHPCNSNLMLGYKDVATCAWFRFGPGNILYTNSECFWVGECSEWQEDRHSSLTFVVSCLGSWLFEDRSASICQIWLNSGGLCLI